MRGLPLLLFCLGLCCGLAQAADGDESASCPPGMGPGGDVTPPSESATAAEKRPSHEPGQLVLFWPDAQAADAELAVLKREPGVQMVERLNLDALGAVLVILRLDPSVDVLALRRHLRLGLRNATLDLNTRYYPDQGPRQYFKGQIHLPPMPPGATLPVGILDGPVDKVPALTGVDIQSRSFLRPGEQQASPRHGTAVAVLVSGRDPLHGFTGTASGARLYVAEIMHRTADGDASNTAALVAAVDWLLSRNVRILNFSLGGRGDAVLARLFERLRQLPVVSVAAAGNSGPDAPPSFPAAYPGVLAVTATNAAYEVYARAGRGTHIGLAAPGEAVWVPDAGDGHYVSGTSFATALVSGAVSRTLALSPGGESTTIRSDFCRTALDLGVPGPDRVFGCGLLQITAASP